MDSVVITGVGVVSCLGTGREKVTRALREGRSGVGLDPARTALGFRSALAGRLDDFTCAPLDKKQRRTLPEFGQYAYTAAREAIAMAGWDEALLRSERTGLILGNDSSARAAIEQADITRREGSTFPLGASLVFHALTSTVTMNLGTILGCRGASWTLAGACASGAHAIGQAGDWIALGRQDRILCGGVQELGWESVASFDATNAFSLRQDDPARASRPFDAARDGLVPSGGAAIVALEREELARRRGAPILGRLRAYAFSADGAHLAAPSGEGLERAMRECLERARLEAAQVDTLCAHATSTPLGDAVEAGAIHRVFGAPGPWVTATKSMTGHELWMAGAAQVVYSVLMGQGGFIAPTINFERQEPAAPPLRIAAETLDQAPRHVLCNAAGFGGTNACLLLELSR